MFLFNPTFGVLLSKVNFQLRIIYLKTVDKISPFLFFENKKNKILLLPE
jgi:hypothetical protein